MSDKKNFTAPFWCIALIIVFQSVLLLDYYFVLQRFYEATKRMQEYQMSASIPDGPDPEFIVRAIIIVVLLAECICYFILRARIQNRKAALIHVSCLLLAVVIMPAIFIYIIDASDTFFPLAKKIQTFLFWSFTMVGHIAFVYMLTKGLTGRANVSIGTAEPGFFDDYT